MLPVANDQRPAVIVTFDNPFDLVIDQRNARYAGEEETLADTKPNLPGKWLCVVGDRAIDEELWHYAPAPGSFVQWRCIPQGGGNDNGGSLRAVLTIIAIVAINYFTAGAGSGWTAALYKVALTVAATALINNLVPIETPKAGGPQYGVRTEGNFARIGQPIPEIFGFDDSYPDLAAQPYNFYRAPGDVTPTRGAIEQYLHMLLIIGAGQNHICRISVGDTDVLNFDEVQIVRIGPGQSTMDGPGTGVETLAEQMLVDPRWINAPDGSLVEMRPGIAVGPFSICPPGRTVDIIGVDLVQPSGMTREVRMRWRNEARLIDDDDEPLGPWVILGSHTTTRETNIQLKFPHDYPVAPGRYQVRCIRTDETDVSNLSSIDVLSLLTLRGHLVDADINVSDCTFVALRIRASGQINGSLRFRARVYRMLPIWNGSTWSAPTITRSPAWAIAQVLRSRGTADDAIDVNALLALSVVWDARYDSFDYKFGEQISTWEAVAMIARVGRAIPLIRGSRYTFVRDAPQTMPLAAYSMRNIRRGSMQLMPVLASSETMRTLDMEFWNFRRWTWETVTAQIHAGTIYVYRGETEFAALGIPAPDPNLRGRIKMPGIIGLNHAKRTVAYTMADRYYRSVDVAFDAELDAQLPAPLNLVLFQHDIGDFGTTGDVVTWDEATLTLTTTEPLPWGDGSHALRLQKPEGSLTAAIAVTRGADDYTAILASDPGFTPLTDDATRERTRFVFGEQTQVGALAKVRSITPSAERRIGMKLVLEDDRVHTIDAPWVAPDSLPPCEVAEPPEAAVVLLMGFGFPGQFPTGAMSTNIGDLQIVKLISLTEAPVSPTPPAPAGWTLIDSGNEGASGSAIAIYASYYSPANAEVTPENFPNAHGLVGLSYPGATLEQFSPLAITGISHYTIDAFEIPTMPAPAASDTSLIVILAGSRENAGEVGSGSWSVDNSVAFTAASTGFVYYQIRVFEQRSDDTGLKTVHKPLGPYTAWGIQLELTYA